VEFCTHETTLVAKSHSTFKPSLADNVKLTRTGKAQDFPDVSSAVIARHHDDAVSGALD
jgi:hypothetical protein